MEALWNLDNKWKLSTEQVLLLFVCSAFVVIGFCATIILRRKAPKKEKIVNPDPSNDTGSVRWSDPGANWITIRNVLIGSVRWSGGRKWGEEESDGSWIESPSPPTLLPQKRLLGLERSEPSVSWQSHNSVSPVWQKPILMGEKCELPRFSGLILYDEKGRLLNHTLTSSRKEHNQQGTTASAIPRTTLKDLL